MKYVALRLLEQWSNLKEYFLNFLPKQSNFKSEIVKNILLYQNQKGIGGAIN